MNVKNNKVLLIIGKPTIVKGILALLKRQDFKIIGSGNSQEDVCRYLKEHDFDPIIISIQDKEETYRRDEIPVLLVGAVSGLCQQKINDLERLDFNLNQNYNNKTIIPGQSMHLTQAPSVVTPSKNFGHKESNGYTLFKDSIFVKNECIYEKVVLSDILWIEAHGAYCKLKMIKKELLLCINLSTFQKLVNIPYIVRVHRSFIINLHKIDAFETDFVHVNERLIPLGPKYRNCLAKVFPPIGKKGIVI